MQSLKLIYLPLLLLSIVVFTSCKDDSEAPAENVVEDMKNSDTAFTKTIEFKSLDGLLITANQYHVNLDSPTIVLCHQAGWSRGEYQEIAPKLNALGYNCLAIDQRSGGTINGVANETAKRASDAGKPTSFNDAKQDITSAVAWADSVYSSELTLWGSSYSSSLVLIVATENDKVNSVLSFSPGEYLGTVKVGESVTTLNKPAFLTSSNSEQGQTKLIFDEIPSTSKTHFIPTGSGEHGSRALWEDKNDHEEYWVAVKAFLGEE